MSEKKQAYLAFTAIGTILLDDNAKAIAARAWDGGKDAAVQKLMQLEEGELPDEAKQIIEQASKNGYSIILVEDENIGKRIGELIPSIDVKVSPGSDVHVVFRENILKYVQETFGVSPEDYRKLLYEISLALAKRKVKKAAEKRDLFIAQAISALDDINKTLNLFSSRIREWYGLHFPELDDLVDEHEDYVNIVAKIGARDAITVDKLVELGFNEKLAAKIVEAAKKSIGADFTEFDLAAVQTLAKLASRLFEVRREIEKYIDEAMMEVAPNIRGLVGPLLGARLIALAGGLQKLAILPASTIQVLGAEKALFRALRTGGKPPKHGVIFQYPAIHRSPRWQRGKIARALAAKLAIAARIDAFTGEYKADMLKEELEKRIQEIKTLYAKPPVRKERAKPRPGRKFRKGGRRKRKR